MLLVNSIPEFEGHNNVYKLSQGTPLDNDVNEIKALGKFIPWINSKYILLLTTARLFYRIYIYVKLQQMQYPKST